MKHHNDGWPELTYRYIEHYAWEPQHLLLPGGGDAKVRGQERIKKVYERLRRQEVPLNYLLNVLLRLLPSSVRLACLEPFGIDLTQPGLASLSLKTPVDRKFIQPDVHLESETARVFIEVKVDAPLKLSQIMKYVKLHTDPNGDDGCIKRSYILFLVKPTQLALTDIKRSFSHQSTGKAIADLLGAAGKDITFGSTSWAEFAKTLQREMDLRRTGENEAAEMLVSLIGDFLADLKLRHLLPEEV